MKFDVSVTGEIDFLAIVKEWTDELKDELQKTTKKIEADIKADAPVGKTGDLKESVSGSTIDNGEGAKFVVDVPYAPYLEFGTIEKVDLNYIGEIDADDYALLFKGDGLKQSGGVTARKFFFTNIRKGFFEYIEKMNQGNGSR